MFAKSDAIMVGSRAWVKSVSMLPADIGVESTKSAYPSVGNRSRVVVVAVIQFIPSFETWTVAAPPAPKMNGLAPVNPLPSLDGSESVKVASAKPAFENRMRSTPNAWDASLVIAVLNPRVRCPPDPMDTISSVPNAGLNGVTPDGNTPSPVKRSALPSAVFASRYWVAAFDPASYEMTEVANGEAVASAEAEAKMVTVKKNDGEAIMDQLDSLSAKSGYWVC